MSAALEYFLGARRDVVMLDLLELSHPGFTQTYRLVRNAAQGVTVTLETAAVETFDYYPMRITELGDSADLDNGIKVDFGDLGTVLPKELDAVFASDTLEIKPVVLYRTYRSDDLSAPLIGPLRLEISTFSFTRQGATFEAAAPYVNRNRTGETYNTKRFPMLRGFLT